MAFPNFSGPTQLPMKTNPSIAGADHTNPVADEMAKKRKKYNASMMGLKVAATPMAPNQSKVIGGSGPAGGGMSRGFPGAGVGGNM